MKYNKTEQRIVDRINKEDKRLAGVITKKYKKMATLETEIGEIQKQQFANREPIRIINDRIRKRCKHTGKTHRGYTIFRDFSPNFRYIFCDDCGESIDKEYDK